MPATLAASFNTSAFRYININTSETPSFETIAAPVGYLSDLEQVETGTAVTVLLAFAYLIYTSYCTFSRVNIPIHDAKIE